MKFLYLPLFVLFIVHVLSSADVIDNVANLIRQGKMRELSKLFATSVDMTILDEEYVYSQAQAEIILDKFFHQNKLQTVTVLHKIDSSPNYRFGVLLITTAKGIFRVTFTLKDESGRLSIIEFRIETDKVK
ncbi:MAG TPA: DUF4783 domain-containing protein [Mucilaginibacter sp.]|jgi:hypothetical protein